MFPTHPSCLQIGAPARFALGLAVPMALVALASAPSPGAPPAPVPRAVAEWEPASGTLIRWPLGISYPLVRELAEDDSVYVLCETQSAENAARSGFQNNGVNLAHCRFLRIATYSHWTRDWGPHSVFDGDGTWGIVDPCFDGYPWVPPDGPDKDGRGWEEDDQVNGLLATALACPLWAMPAYCTGGNFMADGYSTAFSTQQMVNENLPLMSEAEFLETAEAYLGVRSYVLLYGTEDHGIQHIDCWAKLLDEETILVKQVPSWHEEYPRIEQNLQILEGLTNCHGRPYRIVRIETPPYNGYDVAAYTNSLILNRKVYVPTFGIPSDAAALETYRAAMPGYEVLGFAGASGSPWYYYDALHCRTMGIADRRLLRVAHRPLDAEQPWLVEFPVRALIDDRSEAGLIAAELRVRWRREGEDPWQGVPLLPLAAPDSFEARIPMQSPGTVVEYYLEAADSSGRRATRPPVAPDGFYRFTVATDPSAVEADGAPGSLSPAGSPRSLRILPNPFRASVRIEHRSPAGTIWTARILDANGREVRSFRRVAQAEVSSLLWDGRNTSGRPCAAGKYWVVIDAGSDRQVRSALRVR